MTYDFFMGQLRLIAIALISYGAGKGWFSSGDAAAMTGVLTPVGLLIGPWVWSLYRNMNMKLVPKDSVAITADNVSGNAKAGSTAVISDNVGNSVAAKVVGCLLAAFVLLSFAPDAHAQLNIKPSFTQTTNREPDLLAALDAKLLPDLQYALAMAQANDSKVTAPCYQAWISLIEKRQAAVKDLTPPTPGLVTKFEKAVEIRNAIQSDSPFMMACSPVANMVKKDVLGLVGMFAGGALSLGTLVPGL